QNDPHDIPGLLRHLDRWDAVTGWRVNRGAGDSLVRRLSSRVANGARNWLSDEVIQYSGCTFRAFRRECLRGLILYRGFHRFIPTLLKMRGYRVLEVPVRNRPRRFGQSKYGVLNRVFVAAVDLLVVRWMKSRTLHYEVAEDLGGDLIREEAGAVNVLLVGLGRWGEKHLRVLRELGADLWVADAAPARRAWAVGQGVAAERVV